jgi:glucokinase
LPTKDAAGLGVGVPGVVDSSAGEVVKTPNLPLAPVALGPRLEGTFGIRTALGNDVNLGTLGEKYFGAAREADSALGIFVGTGIGGGLVLDGRLYEGWRGAAAEIGHLRVRIDGPECGCGGRGCLEACASRTAIERDLFAALAAGRESVLVSLLTGRGGALCPPSRIRSGILEEALAQQDALVMEVLAEASRVLGLGVASLVNVVDPQVVLLGGGVIEACGSFMVPRIEETARAEVMPGGRNGFRIVTSQLGDDAVALGGVALAQQRRAEYGRLKGVPRPAVDYPQVEAPGFGEVQVDAVRLNHDIVILADGSVKKRKKKLSRRESGSAHHIAAAELEVVCRGQPRQLIIGTGYQGQLSLTPEAEAYLRAQGIRCVAHPSPAAAAAFNQSPGPKALLLHVTC